MIPDVLHLGPFPIHNFGIMLMIALLVAGWLAGKEFVRKGYPDDFGGNVLFAAALGGLVGARLWIIVEHFGEFVRDPLTFILAGGGFVFYGGLLGGAVAVTVVFRRYGVIWLRGADAAAPALAIGQAIGRIGCQLAGDGDWGRETTLPWGMAYPYAVVGWDKPAGVKVHPAPLYECFAYLLIFAYLWSRRTRPAPDGEQFGYYLLLLPAARFLIEFIRVEPVIAFGLTSAQLTGIVLVPLGAWLVWGRR